MNGKSLAAALLRNMLIGVISDTHGLLRPEALAALSGVDHIVHGGDIGAWDIIDALRAIAPVTAVRGNNDTQDWARQFGETANVDAGRHRIHVIHDLAQLTVDPAEYAVVISGHSHRPSIQERNGVLFLNPGSAGPRRFKLPVSIAMLECAGERLNASLRELDVAPSLRRKRRA